MWNYLRSNIEIRVATYLGMVFMVLGAVISEFSALFSIVWLSWVAVVILIIATILTIMGCVRRRN